MTFTCANSDCEVIGRPQCELARSLTLGGAHIKSYLAKWKMHLI